MVTVAFVFPLGNKICWRTVLNMCHDLDSRVSSIYHGQIGSRTRITCTINISKLSFFKKLNCAGFYLDKYVLHR